MEVEIVGTTLMKTVGEDCVVCEQTKGMGIHLSRSFICEECERAIIVTDTSDPRYKFYLKQLRKITNPEICS